jgi:uncharacterized protein (TIGR03067 family)
MRLASGIVCCATMLMFLGCGSKEGGGKETSSGDPKLEGAYTHIGTEMAGKMGKESDKDHIFRFEGNKMIPPKGKIEGAATIQCDPSKNPAEITISKTEASGKIDTSYGIYKLEGDTLTICMIKSDNPADRPKEFKTNNESRAMIWVLQKNK